MLASSEKWLYSPVTLMLPGLTYFEISSRPTCPPPGAVTPDAPVVPVVVVPVAPVVPVPPVAPVAPVARVAPVVGVGRLGYVAVMQHPLESALGPLCDAWSKVIAINPPAL